MTSLSCLLLSTLNFSSEKVCLSANSIHRLMLTWALFHFLYFKTFRFSTLPLHLSLLFPCALPTSAPTPISRLLIMLNFANRVNPLQTPAKFNMDYWKIMYATQFCCQVYLQLVISSEKISTSRIKNTSDTERVISFAS